MKLVDINGVIGYDLKKVAPAVKPEDLIRELDRSGTDCAVVWHTRSLMQVVDGNAEMKAIAESTNGRFLPCYMVHPYMDDIQMPKDLVGYLKKYRPAMSCLLEAERNFPEETAQLLEICYRETGNFRRAYHYACKQKK